MKKDTEKKRIPIEVEFTDGYEKRFTVAILKIYERRKRQQDTRARVAAG